MGAANAAESRRQQLLERAITERRASVQQRQHRVQSETQQALQLEAAVVELSKDVEVRARGVDELQRSVEERMQRLGQRERDTDGERAAEADRSRAEEQRRETQQLDIEAAWHRLEEAVTAADVRHAAEMTRLRKSLQQADERDAVLREKQRHLVAREHEVEARRRRLQQRADRLHGAERAAIDRMKAELAERETLLLDDGTTSSAAPSMSTATATTASVAGGASLSASGTPADFGAGFVANLRAGSILNQTTASTSRVI